MNILNSLIVITKTGKSDDITTTSMKDASSGMLQLKQTTSAQFALQVTDHIVIISDLS